VPSPPGLHRPTRRNLPANRPSPQLRGQEPRPRHRLRTACELWGQRRTLQRILALLAARTHRMAWPWRRRSLARAALTMHARWGAAYLIDRLRRQRPAFHLDASWASSRRAALARRSVRTRGGNNRPRRIVMSSHYDAPLHESLHARWGCCLPARQRADGAKRRFVGWRSRRYAGTHSSTLGRSTTYSIALRSLSTSARTPCPQRRLLPQVLVHATTCAALRSP